MNRILAFCLCAIGAIAPVAAGAAPTTVINVPTTDTQAPLTGRVDLMPTFYRPDYAVDAGAEVGVSSRFELGADNLTPATPDLYFNAKYRLIEEGGVTPALAFGEMGFGKGKDGNPAPNIAYAVAGKHWGPLSFTAGGYRMSKVFAAATGSQEYDGAMLGISGSYHKLTAAADWMSGRNPFGAKSVGIGYQVAPRIELMPTYTFMNSGSYGSNVAGLQAHIDLK